MAASQGGRVQGGAGARAGPAAALHGCLLWRQHHHWLAGPGEERGGGPQRGQPVAAPLRAALPPVLPCWLPLRRERPEFLAPGGSAGAPHHHQQQRPWQPAPPQASAPQHCRLPWRAPPPQAWGTASHLELCHLPAPPHCIPGNLQGHGGWRALCWAGHYPQAAAAAAGAPHSCRQQRPGPPPCLRSLLLHPASQAATGSAAAAASASAPPPPPGQGLPGDPAPGG